MQPEQMVEEMANEVLMRQAEAERSGEPIEEAMWAVVETEAGKQLAGLRDGSHAEEGVEEWQAGMARECAEDIGGRLGEVPEHPTHG